VDGRAAAIAVEDRLHRALALVRVVVTVNMVVLNVWRRDNYDHPALGAAVVAVAVVWTGFALWAYRSWRRRTPLLLLTDLAVAVAAVALTPLAKGPDFNATIPGYWVMGALLAWAIHWHWRGGLVAAVALSAADLGIRVASDQGIDQGNYGNVFLLMIGGPIVGYMCASLQQMAVERDAAQRAAAAAEERTRLARAVHDGVLQVLSLVQRRAGEAGGDLAELGRLAGEQERSLRSLIRQQDTVTSPTGATVDLAGALERLGSAHAGRVDVATPGTPVPVAAPVAQELVAAVSACLDNVRAHVGETAPAWVLLDAVPGEVVVSVRDDGPGIPAGRVEEASAAGRLGVDQSIRGRIADLGGTARLDTGSWGTEGELTVPIEEPT
jgi:signal transduction histidine kinase